MSESDKNGQMLVREEPDMMSITEYLLMRLKQIGVLHIFGVPGDFAMALLKNIERSELEWVGTCNELNAAYAADGYARIKGVGCVLTTYGVGELSALNGIAGAWAERVPVIAITGSPVLKHWDPKDPQRRLHHTLGDYSIPVTMFSKITTAHTVITDERTAAQEIDRVLHACISNKLPVYINIPSDMTDKPCARLNDIQELCATNPITNEQALNEAVEESLQLLHAARAPIVIADVGLVRWKLQEQFLQLLDASGLPFVVLMTGKTIVDESHPQFLGLYMGDRSREYVEKRVEEADLTIMLGVMETDFNTGGFTMKTHKSKTIQADINEVRIRHHVYQQVFLADFLSALTKKITRRVLSALDIHSATNSCRHRATVQFNAEPGRGLTANRLFDQISHYIPHDAVVVAETGVSVYGTIETLMPKNVTFIAQSFYASIGYTVGATLGVCIAAPDRPVLAFIGDGSFQVTCQDLSTMIRRQLHPTIFLINNDGYLIERLICDGAFNDIQMWKYSMLPEVMGGRRGKEIKTEDQLEHELEGLSSGQELSFLELQLPRWEAPESLKLAGASMKKASLNSTVEGRRQNVSA
eukprot:GILJ01012427.1.p1 GENE.GILJ01012427.1~~GILJ01012427.1.p1  ORF type:complete len:585 (-),score=87.02 GILJ01012427.1:204-1958(-)